MDKTLKTKVGSIIKDIYSSPYYGFIYQLIWSEYGQISSTKWGNNSIYGIQTNAKDIIQVSDIFVEE